MRWVICSIGGALAACAYASGASSDTQDLHGRRATPGVVDTGEQRIDAAPRDGHGGVRTGSCSAAWSTLGLFGGDATDVAASPTATDVVLCGTAPASGSAGALFRSTDGGSSWTVVPTLSNRSIYDIEYAPDGTVYVGTIDSVWKSTNDGASFTQQNLAIGLNDQVLCVKVDPSNSMTLWCGVADALGGQPINVMRSLDGGASWANRTPPLSSPQNCYGIAIDPTNSDRVFAVFGGSFGGGQVWTTASAGTNWTNRSAGLPANPIRDVAHDGTRVLVCGGQLFGSQNVGLYTSSNNGQNWTALHDGTWPTRVIHDIEINAADPMRILLATVKGVFESTTGGTSWSFSVAGSGGYSANSVRFDPLNASRIFVGVSSAGVVRSSDGGVSYGQSSAGIQQLNTVSVAANGLDDQQLAVAFQGLNDGGVFTSNDGGATWAIASLPGTRWNTVAFAPDGTLFALSDGPSSIAPEGLYRRNLDLTWTAIGPDQGTLFESELVSLAFGRVTPDLIVSGGSDFGVAGSEATVWVYDGISWTKEYEGGSGQAEDVNDIEILADGTDLNMVACYTDFSSPQIGGALRSIDGGGSWTPADSGLSSAPMGFGLCLSPDDPQTVYLADGSSPGGLYVSTNGGQSWSATGYVAPLRAVECDANDAAVLYGLLADSVKVYASCDSGATFQPYNSGLGAAAGFPLALSFSNGATPQLLFATTSGPFSTVACGVAPGCPQPGCEGLDLNDDCVIDITDLAIVLSNYGQSGVDPEDGDFDDDDDVDIEDLALILSQFGLDCQ